MLSVAFLRVADQAPLGPQSWTQVPISYDLSSSLSSPPVSSLPQFPAPSSLHDESQNIRIEQSINDLFDFGSLYTDEEPNSYDENLPDIGQTRPLPSWSPFALASSLISLVRRPLEALCSQLSALSTGKAALRESWLAGDSDPSIWDEAEKARREIPQYVLDHAPLVHLFSGEKYWPCDIAEHLPHVTPYEGNSPLLDTGRHYNVTNLDELNSLKKQLYLTSDDNVEDEPDWLAGKQNIPQQPDAGDCNGYPKTPIGGRSDAPVIMIVVDKDDGVVDAFYHFFYCYNLGNVVLNVRWGNHVGDWEHTVVRFQDGKPKAVWFSEHVFGQAFTFDAVEKHGKRPIGYSATGTHAMYATPGIHRYVLPWGLLHDETDRGPLWDPLLNMHAYKYDVKEERLRSSTLTPYAPTPWFYFLGRWGDKAYPLSDPRQYYFAGQYHYVDGPSGPIQKKLDRKFICKGEECPLRKSLRDANRIRYWPDGEDVGEEEVRQLLEEVGDNDAWFGSD